MNYDQYYAGNNLTCWVCQKLCRYQSHLTHYMNTSSKLNKHYKSSNPLYSTTSFAPYLQYALQFTCWPQETFSFSQEVKKNWH